MPIRINLLSEQQAAEEMRRRDPVKRGLWLAGFVVALFLLGSIYLAFQGWIASMEIKGQEAKWRSIETNNVQVMTNLAKLRQIEAKLASLDRLATNRFLWAPVFNALQFTLAESIQVSHLRGHQTYTITPEVKAKPKENVRAKPATSLQKISLSVEARDYGPTSGEQIELFRRNLQNNSFFRSVLASSNSVRLTARAQPQEDAQDKRSYVQFTLDCQFLEKTR